ncbi:MAG: aromatic amino acid lyase [Saprospiraceae bacterium]|nr:aromatic amino acid lyase [Saprospiraceae bacterium]
MPFSVSSTAAATSTTSWRLPQRGTGETFYGINTGFGLFCNVRIEHDELEQLQLNLASRPTLVAWAMKCPPMWCG